MKCEIRPAQDLRLYPAFFADVAIVANRIGEREIADLRKERQLVRGFGPVVGTALNNTIRELSPILRFRQEPATILPATRTQPGYTLFGAVHF